MKIIIEGEPKEIAAYELALKDGKEIVINQNVKVRDTETPEEFSKKANQYATKMIFRQGNLQTS